MSKDVVDSDRFVSRRGRQVGVHELDLTGIDIETDTPKGEQKRPKPVVSKKSQKPTPKDQKKNPITPTAPVGRGVSSKKRKVIVAIVIALVALPLLGAELVSAEYRRGASEASSQMKRIVDEQVLPLQKQQSVSSEKIRAIAGQINDMTSKMCRGGLFDNAASLYPRAKNAQINCNETKSGYSALGSSMSQLADQANYLEKLAVAIKPVSEPIGEGYAAIGAQQNLWNEADAKIKALSPPASLKAAHDAVVKSVADIKTSWSKLNTANNEQDAAGFTAAEEEIGKQYESIRATSALIKQSLATTESKLRLEYQNL